MVAVLVAVYLSAPQICLEAFASSSCFHFRGERDTGMLLASLPFWSFCSQGYAAYPSSCLSYFCSTGFLGLVIFLSSFFLFSLSRLNLGHLTASCSNEVPDANSVSRLRMWQAAAAGWEGGDGSWWPPYLAGQVTAGRCTPQGFSRCCWHILWRLKIAGEDFVELWCCLHHHICWHGQVLKALLTKVASPRVCRMRGRRQTFGRPRRGKCSLRARWAFGRCNWHKCSMQGRQTWLLWERQLQSAREAVKANFWLLRGKATAAHDCLKLGHPWAFYTPQRA